MKSRAIKWVLKTVRQVVNFAAEERIDEYGLTWWASAPKIKCLPEPDRRALRPLSWAEPRRFFQALPDHVATRVLFILNTGLHDAEI